MSKLASVMKHIKDGLRLAEKDYAHIASRNAMFDVKPKEDQIKCALYKALSDADYVVHVEASYERNGDRCDLLAETKNGKNTIAIEIKSSWAGRGWVNKPSEQAASWLHDVEKLKGLQEGGVATHGYLVICFAFERGSKWETLLRSEIARLDAEEMKPFSIGSWNGLSHAQFFVMKVFGN